MNEGLQTGTIPAIEYETVVDAIRGAAEKYGDGAWITLQLTFAKDEWPAVEKFLRSGHSRWELSEVVLCHCAEAK